MHGFRLLSNTDQRRQTIFLSGIAALTYLLGFAALLHRILRLNDGHFTYALDDPYIHLALSQSIAHGFYGINPGEAASPSSSILWPYLLAPFAHFGWQPYVPLALNALFSLVVAVLIGAAVARWPTDPVTPSRSGVESARRMLSAVMLVFIGNLLGLTFVGMEHGLQVLLAGLAAWGIIACLHGQPVPRWAVTAAVLGPMVRFENLGIAVALAIALIGQRQIRRAAVLLAASIIPLLAFAAFLHHLHLPLVPTSVFIKSQVPPEPGKSHLTKLAVFNLRQTFLDPHHTVVFVLFCAIAGLTWSARDRARRFALGGSTLAVGLHYLVGPFGWFDRYEVYIVLFAVLIMLHVAHERPRGFLGLYALGLFACSFLYIQAYNDAGFAANQIYRQQFQTHRFLNDFFTGNSIALNDLGLPSYRRRPGLYVLDIVGLGSAEVAFQPNKSTAWWSAITRKHHVQLVILYPMLLPNPPADWTPIGELCLADPPIVVGGRCVWYYATAEAPLAAVQSEFDAFAKTLPARVLSLKPVPTPLL